MRQARAGVEVFMEQEERRDRSREDIQRVLFSCSIDTHVPTSDFFDNKGDRSCLPILTSCHSRSLFGSRSAPALGWRCRPSWWWRPCTARTVCATWRVGARWYLFALLSVP